MALEILRVERRAPQTSGIARPDWRVTLPVVSAATLTLREPRLSDRDALLDLLTAEPVTRFISPPPATASAFARFISFAERQRAAGRFFCFAVVPHRLDRAVGVLQVRLHEPGSEIAEWGFALGSNFWGTGLFMEAARATLEFAFETVGIERLEARTCLLNGRGNGALAKLGAVKEATLRRSFRRDDEYFDQVLWSILRQDWRRSRALFGAAIVH